MSISLRFRHVHLDFHTSEHCQNVGADFDPDVFGNTLQEAKVNSINLFAKCHHGYSYYPTRIGTVHPGLKFDLLGSQIEACHSRGILAPIYVSVMWDELAGRTNPGWMIVDKNGNLMTRSPLGNEWGWATMDVSSGYADYFLAQVEELLAQYTVDGFWFDICFPMANYSPWGKAKMHEAGVRIEDDEAVWAYARQKQAEFFDRCTRLVRRKLPVATMFYNGTMDRDMRRVEPYMTHFEVESLPTTGQWGYLHYPIMGRQARTYGKAFLGMNGRFHTWWGDFGGLKTRDQLDYECGTIVAAGGKVCVGDQLHPSGRLDPAVYRLIGHTYRGIEALEPWLEDAVPVTEVAILATGTAETLNPGISAQSADTEGAAQMFLEMGLQFDIVDPQADVQRYDAIIVPDGTVLDAALQNKLHAYLGSGGKVILSGTAALDPVNKIFQLDEIPVRYLEPAPTRPSYLSPDKSMLNNSASELADDYDYVFYDLAHVVEPLENTRAFGELKRALFSRTWDHFMGHQNAPVGESLKAPIGALGSTRGGGCVLYLAAPLFSAYRRHDYWAYREIVGQMLTHVLPRPLLKREAPAWAEFSLHTQPASQNHAERRLVHVVCYHPRRTSQPIPHVDQSWETANIRFAIRANSVPVRVYLAPDERPVAFKYQDGYIHLDLPSIGVHSVVVVE